MIVVLPIIGPAIVGSGQYLAWTPCHKQPVRLQEGEVEPDLTTVHCSKGSCSARWEVAFKKVGVDWLALWWGPG
ncbi:MAG: hypothetical protein ACRDYX_12490 [Egibacteraceae bacterium]